MSNPGISSLGALQDAARGLKFFQPEVNALAQRAGIAERTLEEKERQLALDREKLEEDKKQCYERLGAEEQKLKEKVDQHVHQMKWEKESLNREKEDFELAKSSGTEISSQQDPVTVEVGGEKFRTEIRTLARCRGSLFPTLVEPLKRDEVRNKRDPYIFIDRDGRHFRFILNYLRQGEKVMRWSTMKNPDLSTLNEILDEVNYYKITGLEKLLKRKIASLKDRVSFEALVKAKYFQRDALGRCKTARDIEIKGNNLTEITFSKVVFCHHVTFEDCAMRSAKFSECYFGSGFVFSNVDLYKATFVNCEGLNDLDDYNMFVFKDTDKSNVEVIPQGRH